jgi:small conductance mechanosensitive channel
MLDNFSVQQHLPTIVMVVGILVVMWAALWLSTRTIRRLADRMEEEDKEHFDDIERWASQLIRFVRHSIEIVAGVAAVFIILRGVGIQGVPRISWEQVVHWLTGPGVRILLVLGGAYVVTRVAHLMIERLHLFVTPGEGPPAEVAEKRKRAETLRHTLSGVLTTVIMAVAALIVLRELGVDITPIITAAGIGGLAVGFGAQNLVRDIISGFFLLLEDQVRVGDVADINGKVGVVEAIRLRTVVLRSLDGTVHVIPNGAITELSNMTKDYSYAVLDVGVAYKENVDNVMDVLQEIGKEFEKDSSYTGKLLGSLQMFGVNELGDSAVVIRIRIKTLPIEQWDVARELRRRIKNTFDAKGIEIPFPHVSIYMGEASKPFSVKSKEGSGNKKSG